jgi:putative ABC transport system permease protein
VKWFTQVAALLDFNVRSLPKRRGAAISAVAGIAFVVAVLVGVLSIAQGFQRVMQSTGSPETSLVLRSGADSEMTSILEREEARIVADAPGVARLNGRPMVSPELVVIVDLLKKSTGTSANVVIRGVEPPAFGVRPDVRIVQGRQFAWGKNEVIAGRGAHAEFSGLDLGSTLALGQNKWQVVGIFEAGGGLPESEIWADAAVLAPAYRRGSTYQTLAVKLASAGSFQQFKDALTADPRLNVKVVRETEFYAEQSRLITLMITGLGGIITSLMAMGAIFGALNTMYTAVAARAREIATLEALGFGSSPVIVSILIESMLLALLGGIIGALGAWAAFDGYRAATMNWQSFSQVTFAFDVNVPLLITGIVIALAIGFIGGLFPAIRAARLPVATALRAA